MTRKQVALSLFWRTFSLLLLLLALSLALWGLTVRALLPAQGPAGHAGTQLAQQLMLARDALLLLPRDDRLAYAQGISRRSDLRVQPRRAGDVWTRMPDDSWHDGVAQSVRELVGPDVVLAGAVNGTPGLWAGFMVDREPYWLYAGDGDPGRLQPRLDATTAAALLLALLGTLGGSALIARRINQPLRELSFAASKIRGGAFDSRLDETNITSEIREVNMGFNRMARELQRVEEDRAVMLAGISHDLRTPLARLRLEAEMSVLDDEARANMADDIDQLDAIIDKFMDYARPGETHLKPVTLARLVDKEAAAFRDPSEIQISARIDPDVRVQADEVELGRVLANLFENARRYGRSSSHGGGSGVARVQVSCTRTNGSVICTVRDHGQGVAAEKLGQLTTPFFRGDAARTAATGAGLGLAIVEKAMQRMGGEVSLANAPDGSGLMVHLRLKSARA